MMNRPKITLRQLDPSPALKAAIEEHAEKVRELFPRATHCEVLVQAPPRHHRHGGTFDARVDLSAPGAVVVGRARDEDAHSAVKQAFATARRRLVEAVERRRRRVA